MQDVLAHVLEQDAAGAVHDRLRLAGGARREQHVPRVVVREQLELGVRCRSTDPPVPCGPHTSGRRRVGADHHTAPDTEPVGQRRGLGDGVVLLARVRVLTGRDEYGGIELAETVDQRVLAEVRRGARERGADRRRGETDDDGLDGVRHDRHDPIARTHPISQQRAGRGPHRIGQPAARQRAARAVLPDGDERLALTRFPEQHAGDVQAPVREERRRRGHAGAEVAEEHHGAARDHPDPRSPPRTLPGSSIDHRCNAVASDAASGGAPYWPTAVAANVDQLVDAIRAGDGVQTTSPRATMPGRGSAGGLERRPHPLAAQRHVDVLDPEVRHGVDHRVVDRRCRSDGARLADALGAHRVARADGVSVFDASYIGSSAADGIA